MALSSPSQPARPAPVGAWHENGMDWEGSWGKGSAGRKCPVALHLGTLALGLPRVPPACFWSGTLRPNGTGDAAESQQCRTLPRHLVKPVGVGESPASWPLSGSGQARGCGTSPWADARGGWANGEAVGVVESLTGLIPPRLLLPQFLSLDDWITPAALQARCRGELKVIVLYESRRLGVFTLGWWGRHCGYGSPQLPGRPSPAPLPPLGSAVFPSTSPQWSRRWGGCCPSECSSRGVGGHEAGVPGAR